MTIAFTFGRFKCRECRSDVTGFLMAKRALEACEDYFDRHATAEMLPDGPSANEEGQLLVEVGEALHNLRGAGDCPLCRYRASCDTQPKAGDVQQAPLVSGAVAATSGETPTPSSAQPGDA